MVVDLLIPNLELVSFFLVSLEMPTLLFYLECTPPSFFFFSFLFFSFFCLSDKQINFEDVNETKKKEGK